MGFTDAIKTCFRKYVTFSGRASRPEYWWFVLFIFLGSFVCGLIDAMLFGGAMGADEDIADGSGPVAAIFGLATLLPQLSAGWRRMHDTGRSGLYLFYPLVVMIGIATFAGFSGALTAMLPGADGGIPAFSGVLGIVMVLALIVLALSPLLVLWWLTRPSQPGTNEYGPNPHEVTP